MNSIEVNDHFKINSDLFYVKDIIRCEGVNSERMEINETLTTDSISIGNIKIEGGRIRNLKWPISEDEVVNKDYVDFKNKMEVKGDILLNSRGETTILSGPIHIINTEKESFVFSETRISEGPLIISKDDSHTYTDEDVNKKLIVRSSQNPVKDNFYTSGSTCHFFIMNSGSANISILNHTIEPGFTGCFFSNLKKVSFVSFLKK